MLPVSLVVFASGRTLAQLRLRRAGRSLDHTQVREDHIHLWFLERAERDWFRLMTVQSGCPAQPLILSIAPPQEIARLSSHRTRQCSGAPGIGPKLAQRILLELKDKAGRLAVSAASSAVAAVSAPAGDCRDAVDALVALGYRRTEAFAAIAWVAAGSGGIAE